jgi:hypothetical protein
VQQPSTLQFLQAFPTPQEAMAATPEEIIAVLKSAGHPSADKTGRSIVEQMHQPLLRAFAITTRTKARLMVALVRQLLPVMEEIATYDKEIKRLFLTHADSPIFSHLPRAGKRLAPRLRA